MDDQAPALDFKEIATRHSAQCFLNSFLREWPEHKVLLFDQNPHIEIDLNTDESLILPLKRFSIVGRHQYQSTFYHKNMTGLRPLSFVSLVERLASFLQKHYKTKDDQVQQFIHRVNLSQQTIQKTLDLRAQELLDFEKNDFDFLASEQALVIGHNFHPTPKSRDEFSDEDMFLYSPEFKGKFKILWLKVSKDLVYEKMDLTQGQWLEQVIEADLGTAVTQDPGFIMYPCHPWQFEVLKKQSWMQDYLQSEKVSLWGQSIGYWYPTSSLRTVYNPEVPFMLKYSLSVKLTNSVRHLLLHEAERGLQVCELLQTPIGQESFRGSQFEVLTEPGFMTLKDQSGMPLCETLLLARKNPFMHQNKKNKIVLSTLVQTSPLGEENLLLKLLQRTKTIPGDLRAKCLWWFRNYLHEVIRPLMILQSRYGLMFGAHQQNLILDLQDAVIKKVYFRDCQGAGYASLGYQTFVQTVKSINKENGNVLPDQMAYNLFSYYVFINSTFNVIAALAEGSAVAEDELLAELRDFLEGQALEENIKDPFCFEYLLTHKELMHKGNFLCSFKTINENTTSDPLAIYVPIKNPLQCVEAQNTKRGNQRSLSEDRI